MRKFFPFWLLLLPIFLPQPVSAHAFGQLYTLPIPVWLYLFGGGAALIISFVVIGLFFNQPRKETSYPKVDLTNHPIIKLISSTSIKNLLQTFSLLFFGSTLLVG